MNSKQSNETSGYSMNGIYSVIILLLVVALAVLGYYAMRLQKELNGSRASYSSLRSSVSSQLKTCVANAGSGYAYNSVGVTGAIPQQVNLNEFQTQINACKAEYGN